MREAKLVVSCGKKGVVKSYTTNRMIAQYVQGNAKVPPRKVLILDVNSEYSDIKTIGVENIIRFCVHPIVEARRIVPITPQGKEMSLNEIAGLLGIIVENFRGGLLLFRSINKYVTDNLPQDIVGIICTNRHKDLDIVMHFQSIGRITPKIWQNMSILRFHKNTDSVERHKGKFEDKYEMLSIVENVVNARYMNGDPRFYCYVDVEEMKIITKVNKKELEMACEEYISKNYNKIIRPIMAMRDGSGKKKMTTNDAVKKATEHLIKTYT